MTPRLRTFGLLAVSLAWIVMAYAPLVRAGFTGGDLERLARAGGWHLPSLPSEPSRRGQQTGLEEPARPPLEFDARELLRVAGPEGSFVAGLSLVASYWMWGSGVGAEGGWSPAVPYRLENLILLAIAGLGLGHFVRRLLLPWTGEEQASLAGWAAGLFAIVHPGCVATVASLEGRADLLALAFSAHSGALFLRARQERVFGFMLASIGLAMLAAFSGELSFALPFGLALAEGLSAHRYRPRPQRLRTAFNTFAVFFGIMTLNGVAIASVTGHSYLPEVALGVVRLGEPGALASALADLPEKVGLAILPANPRVLGVLGLVLAGALLLAALQPGLFAARTAPRLWGGVLVWWLAAFAFAMLFGIDRPVEAGSLAGARELVPLAFVAAGGLGAASTAVGGLRRRVLPVVVGFGLAALCNANAQPWAAASQALDALRADIVAARDAFGGTAPMIIVDPPRDVNGLDPLGPGLPFLLHPVFTAAGDDAMHRVHDAATEPLRVRETSLAGFLMLARQAEFAELIAEPHVVLYPEEAIAVGPGRVAGTGRGAALLAHHGPSRGPVGWDGAARSPALDLEPLDVGALRAVASGGGYEPVALRFSGSEGSEPAIHGAWVRGAWVSSGGRRVGLFDLSSSLAWRLAGRIDAAWFDEATPGLERADFLPDLPAPVAPLAREADGDDWRFGAPPLGELVVPEDAVWRFELLDLDRWTHAQLPVVASADGSLLVLDAARVAGGEARRLAYQLDLTVDGLAVLRSTGRVEP